MYEVHHRFGETVYIPKYKMSTHRHEKCQDPPPLLQMLPLFEAVLFPFVEQICL